jgi:WD40 repeat protein
LRTLGVAITLAASACLSDAGMPERGVRDLGMLAAHHPEIRALIAQASRSPARREGGTLRIATRAGRVNRSEEQDAKGRTWRIADVEHALRLELAEEDASVMRLSGDGFAVTARRAHSGRRSADVEGDSVVVRGKSGIEAALFAVEHGVEDLEIVEGATARLAYDFELPLGFRLRAPPSYPGLVEMLDARGVARLRVWARKGWDADGNEVAVMPIVEGARVRIEVPGTAAWPVVVDPEFTGTGAMVSPRFRHTATLLGNGKVLIAGGKYAEVTLATAELYDPATATFTASMATMMTPRAMHVATPLPGGRVLLIGASDAGSDLYDPATDTFSSPLATAHLGSQAEGMTATLLQTGKVLLVGGGGMTVAPDNPYYVGSTLSLLFDPDPHAETFTPTKGTISWPRAFHTATLLEDGRVLIAGGAGYDNGFCPYPSAEIYDPGTDTFESGPPMLTAGRLLQTSTLLADGTVLIAGGHEQVPACPQSQHDAQVFDPGAWAFSDPGPMPNPRYGQTATLLPDGSVMLAGGNLGTKPGPDNGDATKDGSVSLYSSQKGFVPSVLSLTTGREGHTATLLADGTLLFAGGTSMAGSVMNSAEVYTAFDFVSVPSPMPLHIPRKDHRATLLPNGRVLLTGGVDGTGQLTSTTETFDPSTGSLTLGKMLDARARHSATMLVTGQVLLAGGACGPTAELYDPVTGTSVFTGHLTTPRTGHAATLLPDGRVLVAGGTTLTSPDAEIYDPVKGTFELLSTPGVRLYDAETATLLRDGRVLILGASSSTLFDPSKLNDPSQNGFKAGPQKAERQLFSATLVPDGRVIVSGGQILVLTGGDLGDLAHIGSAPVNPVEIFDPVTDSFTFGAQAEAGPATATLLMSGRVLFAGYQGFTGYQPGAMLYDPLTDHYDDMGMNSGPSRVRGETATLLPSGDVLLAGGVTHALTNPSPETFIAVPTLWHAIPSPAEAGTTPTPFAPTLVTGPGTVVIGQTLTLEGQGFTGMSSATGDGSNASPTSFPVSVWLPTEGGVPEYGFLSSWSAGHATWTPPASVFRGLGLLFVVTNGVPSNAAPILVRPEPIAKPCETDNDCVSSVCLDGVCCERPCSACESCSAKGKGHGVDGICGPALAGPDLRGVCFACDGMGHCAPGVCDGGHRLTLRDGSHQDCAPYRCSTTTNRCLDACASNFDCSEGSACAADGHCGARLEPGASPGCSATRAEGAGIRRAFMVAILVLSFGRRTRRRRHLGA